MRALVVAAVLVAALAVPALAQPPQPDHSTDAARCQWHWQQGGGLGVWTERCALDTGVWEPKFDEKLPGFVITIDGKPDGVVLQVFSKPADAEISAILPELKKRGYIPDDNDCVFEVADIARPLVRTQMLYQIVPVGARKAALDATPADQVPDPPCGDYGWAPDGMSYFLSDLTHPDRIVYVNTGQDGLMFDETTITLE